MKKIFTLTLFLIFGLTLVAEAQLRENLNNTSDYSATIKSEQSSTVGSWMNMLNMTMDHSYTMSFSNVGGQFQNLNAYTNHMTFDFSESMTGHLDVSVLHSPFGNSFMDMGNNNLGSRIIIDRAQLDYQITPNTSLSIQFSQRPYYRSPFGYDRGPFTNPYNLRY